MNIPKKLVRLIERKLRSRSAEDICMASKSVIELRSDALSIRSPGLDRVGGRSSGISDRVSDGVGRAIEAEERLSSALRWEICFLRLDQAFVGTPEEEVARLMYRDNLPIKQIAESLGVDRQTVCRRRENYLTHAALLAAEAGLIRMREYIGKGGDGA